MTDDLDNRLKAVDEESIKQRLGTLAAGDGSVTDRAVYAAANDYERRNRDSRVRPFVVGVFYGLALASAMDEANGR